jgi:hypothetical protein
MICRYCGKDLPEFKPVPEPPEPEASKGEKIGLVAFLVAVVIAGTVATLYFKHADAVSLQQHAVAAATPSAPQIVRLTKETSFTVTTGAVVILSRGTNLIQVGRNGDRVFVSYEGANYEIPVSWTDLNEH